MVVAEVLEQTMRKPILKVSVSDPDFSSVEESEESENETQMDVHDTEEGAVKISESNLESTDDESEVDAVSEDENPLITNEGWADSVAKILSSSKPKNKKSLVLSRAKKYVETVKKVIEEKPAFEVIGETKKDIQVKVEEKWAEAPAKKVKQEKPSIRLKPNILEKDRERLLAKIATKGVVQLFNAVRNQQKTLEREIDRTDISEGKKEKILKKFDKRAFLDTLMGQTKSIVVDKEEPEKDEVKAEEDKPRWSALRDDFMMGAKMKDWDKESVE